VKNIIILRYGELHLKGHNRGMFERILISNIKAMLFGYVFKLKKISGRYIISDFDSNEKQAIILILSRVFGLVSLSDCAEIDTSEENILKFCNEIKLKEKSFRATVKRADKKFPITSDQFAKIVGTTVCESNKDIKVDLHNPEVEVYVDIRDNGKTYISTSRIPCVGGMPFGSAGKALSMLSGGIDSPVASYMMAKRGLAFDAIHFHSFPHTSLQAREKVVSLAKELRKFVSPFKLYICCFTKIQEEIHKHCDEEYGITIMRRIMLRICEKICQQNKLGAIITGESLGQVASQTMQSITCTNSVLETIPVFRPLIGFDKNDIISVATKIGTYDISILPYEDCCTVFLPEKPIIKPTIKHCLRQESFFDFEPLIQEAVDTIEILNI